MDSLTGYRTRSVLCVPMIDARGDIIGVVQAINKNPLYPRYTQIIISLSSTHDSIPMSHVLFSFDAEDETLLKTFSAQAALAVRNSQLLAQREAALRQSDALLVVTNALAKELKIGSLIKIIVSKVQHLLEAERCTVYIVDKERKELYTSDAMSYGMGPALPIDRNRAKMIHFPMDR
jgi:GAF domain-containing protein